MFGLKSHAFLYFMPSWRSEYSHFSTSRGDREEMLGGRGPAAKVPTIGEAKDF